MARIWTEIYDHKRHSDRMAGWSAVPGIPKDQYWKARTLQQYPVYFVRVCNFTFEFHSIQQVEASLKFFSKKVRPSSRIKFTGDDRKTQWLHWKAQRWFDRIPMHLLEERRRVQIVAALKQAIDQFKGNAVIA